MSSLVQKIRKETEWDEIFSLLQDITHRDIASLKKIIPKLLNNKSWVVCAEVLDIIGEYNIDGFKRDILAILNDSQKNNTLRVYALFSYYDLCKGKSNNLLKKYTKNSILDIRLAALCLYYIEREQKETLEEIRKIVTRKNCSYLHQASAIHIFMHYMGLNPKNEIVELFQEILLVTKNRGIKKELSKTIKTRDGEAVE